MLQLFFNTSITFIVSAVLGYCFNSMKNYKAKLKQKDEEGELLKNALMTILQNNLTNTYFSYESMEEIPDYVYKNWLNSLKMYEELGGNDYCHTLKRKIENWKIVKTDILIKNKEVNYEN